MQQEYKDHARHIIVKQLKMKHNIQVLKIAKEKYTLHTGEQQ